MTIRTAALSDASEIARIHIETWRVAYSDIVPENYLAGLSIELREKRWLNTLSVSQEGTRVALDEKGHVIGWTSFGLSRDEDGLGIGEIYAIYLDYTHWGKGIGRELLKDALISLFSNGFEFITLWMLEDNHRARKFYEKAGFVHDGFTKNIVISDKSLLELRYKIKAPQIT